MPMELKSLFGGVIILIVMLVAQIGMLAARQGPAYGLGPRDTPAETGVMQGRMNRAIANHMESLAMFAPLALIAHQLGLQGAAITTASWLYLAGRALFPFAYLSGVPGLRTLVWALGFSGVALLATQVGAVALR